MKRDAILNRLPSLSKTKRYLTAKGWHVEGNSDKYTLFNRIIEGEPFELILAKNEDVSGWEKTIYGVVESMSDYYNQTLDDLVFEIAAVRHDVLRSRLPDSHVQNETIDLDTAVEFIGGLKGLMVSVAAAEVKQKQAIARAPDQASKYGKDCRFGHTFKGSFGFIVESPMIIDEEYLTPALTNEDQGKIAIEEPFERKVVRRLAKGLHTLDQAVLSQDTKPLREGYQDGFSANVLDALLDLHKAAKLTRVKFDFIWSPELPVDEISKGLKFELGSEKMEVAETASRELKQQTKPERETVVGYVTDLHTDINTRTKNIFHDDRKVVIKLSGSEYRDRNLHILLSDEEYKKAIAAHRDRAKVSIEGKMVKQGRHWFMLDPSSLAFHQD